MPKFSASQQTVSRRTISTIASEKNTGLKCSVKQTCQKECYVPIIAWVSIFGGSIQKYVLLMAVMSWLSFDLLVSWFLFFCKRACKQIRLTCLFQFLLYFSSVFPVQPSCVNRILDEFLCFECFIVMQIIMSSQYCRWLLLQVNCMVSCEHVISLRNLSLIRCRTL